MLSDAELKQIKVVLNGFDNIDYAFVFGSATKTLLQESDIDILVGGDLDFMQRTDLSLKLEQIFKRPVDIVLAKKASPEITLKAFSEGIAIVVNNSEVLKKDYFRNFYAYEDALNLRRIKESRLKRRFGCGR